MTSLTQKDLEAISAYIDQALSRRERIRLEERLKQEPELLAELNSMRRTRRILRSAPMVKAPRHFTLTPEMVESAQPKPQRLLPVTRFAFALASIFFVFTLVGRFTFGSVAGVQTEQSLAYPAEAEEAPMAPEAFEEERVAEDAMIVSPEVMELEVQVEAEAQESADLPPEIKTSEAAEAETIIVEVTETVSKEPGGGGGFQPEPTMSPTPVAEEAVTAPQVTEEEAVAGETSILEASPSDAVEEEVQAMVIEEGVNGEAMDEELAIPMVYDESAASDRIPSRGLDAWGLAAVISGVLAAVSGGASLLLRKRMK